jgi:hypothetical protein
MKTNKASFSVLGTLVLAALLIVGILKIQQVHAQVDATSSDTVASPTEVAPPTDVGTSTNADTINTDTTAATTPPTGDTTTPSNSVTPTEPPPQGLSEVHIIGTKFTDYFTDGTTTTSYPGDPQIDAHFAEKNAPIPTHEGLTWVHTTGGYLYDTPSGDLEVGDYALQLNGSYITNAPSSFVSSTSTPEVLGASTSASDIPSETSSVLPGTPTATDATAPATTSEDSTTPPVTNDSVSDDGLPSATATTTDTSSI